jgi:hypothetical protein
LGINDLSGDKRNRYAKPVVTPGRKAAGPLIFVSVDSRAASNHAKPGVTLGRKVTDPVFAGWPVYHLIIENNKLINAFENKTSQTMGNHGTESHGSTIVSDGRAASLPNLE